MKINETFSFRYDFGKREKEILVNSSGMNSMFDILRFLFICFARNIKGFYQSSLGNEVDFRDIMNVSPNILAKIKISKN